MVLLKKEGAKLAAWLLVFITLAYVADNQLTGKNIPVSPDAKLFPKEEMLVSDYIQEPLSSSPFLQKKQLE